MLTTSSSSDLKEYLANLKSAGKTIGFVATMGALHGGHMALIQRSKRECDATVCSIFVNPTQFNNPEDLEKYPRNLSQDLELLDAHHCDIAFIPTVDELYEEGEQAKAYDFGGIEVMMEGKFRPGHFDGVGTIINKLCRLIEPNRAYFGEKDWQQLLVVKKLAEIEGLNTEMVGCSIEREESGLAMSSRNFRLSQADKERAAFIFQQLQWAKDHYATLPIANIEDQVNAAFCARPEFDLEYFWIVDGKTMQPISDKEQAVLPRAFVAAHLSGVRLIDNISLI